MITKTKSIYATLEPNHLMHSTFDPGPCFVTKVSL